jgi:transcriptional regulator PpsR
MVERPLARPDITLTLDSEGVIRDAVSSRTLQEERLDDWRGRSWEDTLHPEINGEVAKMIEALRVSGDSSCVQVRQRFPSGRELQIEYTTVSLGRKGGFVAVGRNLETVAELQGRLAEAQKARERDYWKLREVETRHRLVFDASSEAVALVRPANMRVVEANLAASRALGLVPGVEFLPDLAPRERKAFEAMLERAREQGRAPGIVVHSGGSTPWSLRASMLTTQSDAFYLFQISTLGGGEAASARAASTSLEQILRRLPDGFAVVDRDGVVRRANDTFLDLAQAGSEAAVVGQPMKRWLSRPGADIGAILAMARRHGSVRMLTTTIEGELGASTDVEVSAVGDANGSAEYFGLLIRDVTSRSRGDAPPRADAVSAPADAVSLEALVRTSTEAVERVKIAEALNRFEGHRTAAAKYLGLSRQSLHTKLKKYGFEDK